MIGFLAPRVFVDEVARDDADAMAEIHGLAFARAWSPYDFASLLNERNVFAIGARRESPFRGRRLVGFVLVRTAAGEAEILSIAVRAASRRRGLGKTLMLEALRRLYRERAAACFLEVDGGNAAAVSLYRSLGFETVGERKGYYPRPAAAAGAALVMRLSVR